MENEYPSQIADALLLILWKGEISWKQNTVIKK